jgi:hypothetical protein
MKYALLTSSTTVNAFKEAQSTDEKLYFAAFLQKQTTPQAQMRTRLLQFLQTSTLYNPETVLKSLSRIELYSIEACVVLAKVIKNEYFICNDGNNT